MSTRTAHDIVNHPFPEVHIDIRWASMMSGMSQGHLRRLCRAGQIPGAHRRHGTGNWRIPLTSLDRDLTSAFHWYWEHRLATPHPV